MRITIYSLQFTNFNILSSTAQTFKKKYIFVFASLLITRSRRYHPYRRRASGHGCPHGLSTVIDFASLAAEGSYTTSSERRDAATEVDKRMRMRYFCANANGTTDNTYEECGNVPFFIPRLFPFRTIRSAKYFANLNILYYLLATLAQVRCAIL